MELCCNPPFNSSGEHPPPPTISWQAMFQQYQDYHDLGHRKGYPPRIARWMAAQRRQYRHYGIGKKTPVGIIKQRIQKLNSLGFSWEAPINIDEGAKRVEELANKKRAKIKHNLLADGMKKSQEYNYLTQSRDFLSPDRNKKAQMQQNQSSRGRIRMPSRRMQESYETELQIESMEDVEKLVSLKTRSEDESTTSGDGSSAGPIKNYRTFPGILLDMVNGTSETNPDIIEWLPCGTAFRINDEDAICDVLQKYFRHDKLSSFIRQLNLYGFSKKNGAYSHPLFNQNSKKEKINRLIERGGKPFVAVAPERPPQRPSQTGRPTRKSTGVEDRYVKQLCHQEGCYKYIASHCSGYCMQHFNEMKDINETRIRPTRKTTRVEDRYVKQLCHWEGCRKYIASHCSGYCMQHFKEMKGVKAARKLKKVTQQPTKAEKSSVNKPEKQQQQESNKEPLTVTLNKPKDSTPSKQTSQKTSPRNKPKRKSPSPTKKSSRAKPMKSLYPHSKQNPYNHPTGHAVAHLPSEPATEFGSGWTTRTLQRPNPTSSKTSDTYFYSPVMQFKFRSRIQVLKFLECLKKCNGDEGKAIWMFKGRTGDVRG